MNSISYLKNKISGLTGPQKEMLHAEIKNAPKQLLLINTLTQSASLQTHTAIEQIYSPELKKKVEYSILQNRFYKLKKKLGEVITSIEKNSSSVEPPENAMQEWELEYYKCRKIIRLGNYLAALERLNYLEKKLKHIEAYELLHRANTLQLYCISRLGKMTELAQKLKVYEKHLELFMAVKKGELDEVNSKTTISFSDLKAYTNFLNRQKRTWLAHKHSNRLKLKYNYLKLEFDNFLNSTNAKKKSKYKKSDLHYRWNYRRQLQHLHVQLLS